jgi:glycosyltransferase involved in cell wall biosynthesis
MSTTPIKVSVITSVYRPGAYLESFLQLYLNKFSAPNHELILVHNDATDEERAVIGRFSSLIRNLRHICVDRETVYASWNRAVKASSGEYLAIWNVDDRRSSYGFQQQVMKLDQKPNAMIVSGDYVKVFKYGHTKGIRVNEGLRRSWLMRAPRFRNGCFLMWRRSLHEEIGYFDEQFQVAGDRDFWYRVTRRYRAEMARGTMGLYLREAGSGLSRTNAGVQARESALVAWRYAAVVLSSPMALRGVKEFQQTKIVNFGQPVPVEGLAQRTFLWAMPSVVLFFVPALVKLAVEARFALVSVLRRGQKTEGATP